jgi:hypothetical protein
MNATTTLPTQPLPMAQTRRMGEATGWGKGEALGFEDGWVLWSIHDHFSLQEPWPLLMGQESLRLQKQGGFHNGLAVVEANYRN